MWYSIATEVLNTDKVFHLNLNKRRIIWCCSCTIRPICLLASQLTITSNAQKCSCNYFNGSSVLMHTRKETQVYVILLMLLLVPLVLYSPSTPLVRFKGSCWPDSRKDSFCHMYLCVSSGPSRSHSLSSHVKGRSQVFTSRNAPSLCLVITAKDSTM